MAKESIEELYELLNKEMSKAFAKFGDFHSPHELWGILKEEEEEYWDSVKANKEDLYELLQLAGVAIRYINQQVLSNPEQLDIIKKEQKARWDRG
jgi:hypothetical protein